MYKNQLINLREEKDLKQREIIKMLNIRKSTYSEYENEYKIIPIKHLNAFSNFYNVSLDYIFEFTNIKRYPNYRGEIDKKLTKIHLKELRKKHELTQKSFGDVLKCSKSAIGGYERGINLIATPFLYDICKKYNISADYLLGKIDHPKYLK